jgi:hypothetical protein
MAFPQQDVPELPAPEGHTLRPVLDLRFSQPVLTTSSISCPPRW